MVLVILKTAPAERRGGYIYNIKYYGIQFRLRRKTIY